MLARIVGLVPTLAAVAVMLLLLPLQSVLARNVGRRKKAAAVVRDERVRLMRELVSGIRVMKQYAWEPPYALRVAAVRTKEVAVIFKAALLRAVGQGIYMASSSLIGVVMYLAYKVRSSLSLPLHPPARIPPSPPSSLPHAPLSPMPTSFC